MSLNVNATSSAENAVPSLHFTPLRSLKVQLRPSVAVVQLSARSGAGARSFPGLVTPAYRTRLMKSDSTNALGLHGLRVGSAPIGMVTVPPTTGAADAAVEALGVPGVDGLAHADAASAPAKMTEMTRSAGYRITFAPPCAAAESTSEAAAARSSLCGLDSGSSALY